ARVLPLATCRSRQAATPTRRAPRCSPSPASDRGPPTTSRCVHCVSPTRSPPVTSACVAPSRNSPAHAAVQSRRPFRSARFAMPPRPGAHGVRMPLCIFGLGRVIMLLWSDDVETPIGRLGLFVIPESGAMCALDFGDDARYRKSLLGKRFGEVKLEAKRDPRGYSSLVRDYFDGDMTALGRIPVDTGGTPFQRKVW